MAQNPPPHKIYLVMMLLWGILGLAGGFIFGLPVVIAWFLSGIVIPKIELKPKVDVQWTKE